MGAPETAQSMVRPGRKRKHKPPVKQCVETHQQIVEIPSTLDDRS